MTFRLTLILGALAAALGAGWWIYAREQRIDDLRAEVASQAQTIRNHEEAARMLTRHIQEERQIRADLESAIEELSTLEGADDPLSDYGRAVLERVR